MLDQKSAAGFLCTTSSGATVQVSAGRKVLIVSFTGSRGGAMDAGSVHQSALADAQEGLDLMGLRVGRFYGLPSAYLSHILWWPEVDGPTLRITDYLPMTLHSSVAFTVTRANGDVERSEDAPLPNWEEAFRYLRYSQLTTNLYDAYRTAYLALEALLSHYYPKQAADRGDKAWNLRAIADLNASGLAISSFVDTPTKTAPEDFIAEQYVAHRCAQDHAKETEPHFLPGELDERVIIQRALYQLGRFLTAAIGHLTGTNVAAGTTTLAGIAAIANQLSDLRLFVSSDASPANAEDTEVSPQGLDTTVLSTTGLGKLDAGGYDYGWRGSVKVVDLNSRQIATLGTRVEDVLYSRATIPELDLSGFTTLEYQHVQYWSANGGLRREFEF